MLRHIYLTGVFILLEASAIANAQPQTFFGIQVLDSETGRGVPLVELRTVNQISYWTDSAGWIAFDEPALFGKEVFFFVESHGYEKEADGFGNRGVRLLIEPGKATTVRLQRKNIAERLYRVTGEGIFRDSILLGKETPVREPLLNAKVLGSDSVQSAFYLGNVFWFWGDTNRPNYPLGNFHTPGATSQLPGRGGLDPAVGIDLQYFQADDGFAKETCRMDGDGPTWLDGLCVVGSDDSQRMFAGYAKIKAPMDAYERGIVEWDIKQERFVKRIQFAPNQAAFPRGHSLQHEENEVSFVYFCHPLPMTRVPATAEAILNLECYETFSYFKSGSTEAAFELDRNPQGELIWDWRKNTIAPTRELEGQLVAQGKLRRDECAMQLAVKNTERKMMLHSASIDWSDFLKRWVMIGLEVYGEASNLGEIYYSEAKSLEGPWSPAVKIVTHNHYSFYNPRWHPMLTGDQGRSIFFEGTYTQTFSAARQATPRYDYNQIMYRLDLTDARLREQDK